jgi:hypothetical protein
MTIRWFVCKPIRHAYSVKIYQPSGSQKWRVIYRWQFLGDFDSFGEALEACRKQEPNQ